MPSHLRLIKPEPPSKQDIADTNLAAFLTALTDVSERFGIVISEDGHLYEMESDDRLSAYRANAESRLHRA